MSAGSKADTLGLDVSIMGRDYRIACKPEERQELLDAVAHVDQQMRDIRDTAKQNNAERVAVMAALNVTHELLRARAAGAGAGESARDSVAATDLLEGRNACRGGDGAGCLRRARIGDRLRCERRTVAGIRYGVD